MSPPYRPFAAEAITVNKDNCYCFVQREVFKFDPFALPEIKPERKVKDYLMNTEVIYKHPTEALVFDFKFVDDGIHFVVLNSDKTIAIADRFSH